MKVYTHVCRRMLENCYIIANDDKRAILIDPGSDERIIQRIIQENELKIEAVLLTHGHCDHTNATFYFQENGAMVYIHEADANMLQDITGMCFALGMTQHKVVPDVTLSGDETLHIAGFDVKVLHTPGHSKGGLCFIIENCMFSGDTLFHLTYGRTDFRGGDFQELKNSILNKLFALKGDYEVYPGHEQSTTLEYERKFNPIRNDAE